MLSVGLAHGRGRKTLRKALASLADETLRTRPERRDALLAQMVKLDQQIAKGTENLLLLAPADIPAATALLAQWRTQRDELQAELDNAEETKPATYDADAILAELDELEQHLTGDSLPLAKAAFQRVFESISHYWETVSPRRRELVRAEITPRFPFCLTVDSSIQARGQTKRETLVVDFKTSKQSQTDRIVETLERLYAGKPVGSVAIGNACKMEHAQVLKYLHRAKDAGRATPVLSGPGGVIRGWVPANVAVTESIAERSARRAADAVEQLTAKRTLVSASVVARHLNVPEATVARWLKIAEQMGLVRSRSRRGWMSA